MDDTQSSTIASQLIEGCLDDDGPSASSIILENDFLEASVHSRYPAPERGSKKRRKELEALRKETARVLGKQTMEYPKRKELLSLSGFISNYESTDFSQIDSILNDSENNGVLNSDKSIHQDDIQSTLDITTDLIDLSEMDGSNIVAAEYPRSVSRSQYKKFNAEVNFDDDIELEVCSLPKSKKASVETYAGSKLDHINRKLLILNLEQSKKKKVDIPELNSNSGAIPECVDKLDNTEIILPARRDLKSRKLIIPKSDTTEESSVPDDHYIENPTQNIFSNEQQNTHDSFNNFVKELMDSTEQTTLPINPTQDSPISAKSIDQNERSQLVGESNPFIDDEAEESDAEGIMDTSSSKDDSQLEGDLEDLIASDDSVDSGDLDNVLNLYHQQNIEENKRGIRKILHKLSRRLSDGENRDTSNDETLAKKESNVYHGFNKSQNFEEMALRRYIANKETEAFGNCLKITPMSKKDIIISDEEEEVLDSPNNTDEEPLLCKENGIESTQCTNNFVDSLAENVENSTGNFSLENSADTECIQGSLKSSLSITKNKIAPMSKRDLITKEALSSLAAEMKIKSILEKEIFSTNPKSKKLI